MAAPVPGDIVAVRETFSPPTLRIANLLTQSDRWVVVLIHPPLGEDYPAEAGLRMPEDAESAHPISVPLGYLDVVDHLTEVDGYEEVEHGVWRKL
jgi:hypothetical protein